MVSEGGSGMHLVMSGMEVVMLALEGQVGDGCASGWTQRTKTLIWYFVDVHSQLVLGTRDSLATKTKLDRP